MTAFQLPLTEVCPDSRHRPKTRRALLPPIPHPDTSFATRRPLAPLSAVVILLNRNARDVMALIEEGKLKWAFDIRSDGASARQVRVLRQCLHDFTGQPRERVPRRPEDFEFEEILDLIVPPGFTLSSRTFLSRLSAQSPATQPAVRRPQCSESETIQRLLYPTEPVVWGTEVARRLSCSPQHVRKLVHEGSLKAANMPRAKATPAVLRSSVIEFLKKRRLA